MKRSKRRRVDSELLYNIYFDYVVEFGNYKDISNLFGRIWGHQNYQHITKYLHKDHVIFKAWDIDDFEDFRQYVIDELITRIINVSKHRFERTIDKFAITKDVCFEKAGVFWSFVAGGQVKMNNISRNLEDMTLEQWFACSVYASVSEVLYGCRDLLKKLHNTMQVIKDKIIEQLWRQQQKEKKKNK